MLKTCVACGVEFELSESDANRGRGTYCGMACYHKGRTGKERGQYKPSEERLCLVCEKPFLVGGRGNKGRRQRVCSMECQRRMRRRKCAAICRDLSPVEVGYLAGIMDGEGSIMLAVVKDRGIYLLLSITNTHRPLMDWVVETTGIGRVCRQYKEGAINPNRKETWFWRCTSDAAESFLQQIAPHLIVKREQVNLALAFQIRLRNPAMKAAHEWQQGWAVRMKALNAKGPQTHQLSTNS